MGISTQLYTDLVPSKVMQMALAAYHCKPHSWVPKSAETILLTERLNASLVTTVQICSWTDKDPTLAKVRKSVLQGWPDTSEDKEMDPYFQRRDELSIDMGCFLWSARVAVPPQLRAEVVQVD